ncbi:unnamed protein product [Ranitomeya imitator]|uniref:MADF domain-containing protein n=1 Tax=Ranitomeya imitator TaxID=111125 RepID=A0ABN9LN12_9NEOB|nr:unnamed protein product [Ranitomeya imitator]
MPWPSWIRACKEEEECNPELCNVFVLNPITALTNLWMKTIVRKKIQALRTVYKKELNKVEKSKKSGAGADDVYVPKLWYFDLLAFTRDQEIPRPAQTVTSLCALSAEESPDEHVPPEQLDTLEGTDSDTPHSSASPCVEEQTGQKRPCRKRKATRNPVLV